LYYHNKSIHLITKKKVKVFSNLPTYEEEEVQPQVEEEIVYSSDLMENRLANNYEEMIRSNSSPYSLLRPQFYRQHFYWIPGYGLVRSNF